MQWVITESLPNLAYSMLLYTAGHALLGIDARLVIGTYLHSAIQTAEYVYSYIQLGPSTFCLLNNQHFLCKINMNNLMLN